MLLLLKFFMNIQEIPIAIAFDEEYIIPSCVMLTSLVKNANDSTTYQITIFAQNNVRDIAKPLVQKILNRDHSFRFVDPGQRFVNAKNRKHLTEPNYYRFLIPEFLCDAEKAIWLDVDMIVRNDLSEVYQTELEDNYLGVVLAGFESTSIDSISKDHYFNAGFLLLNLEAMRQDHIADNIMELIEKNDFSCPTQDPLNIIAFEKTIFLHHSYNVLISGKLKQKDKVDYLSFHKVSSLDDMIQTAVVVHYVGNLKPWNDRLHPYSDLWMEYFRNSIVADETLNFRDRCSATKKVVVKIMSFFIASKAGRRRFRDRYLT